MVRDAVHSSVAPEEPRLVSGLAELTLETENLEQMERFYRDLLGLEVLTREEDRVRLALDGSTRLGLWSPGPKEFGDRGGRHVHFALSTARDQLEELSTACTSAASSCVAR